MALPVTELPGCPSASSLAACSITSKPPRHLAGRPAEQKLLQSVWVSPQEVGSAFSGKRVIWWLTVTTTALCPFISFPLPPRTLVSWFRMISNKPKYTPNIVHKWGGFFNNKKLKCCLCQLSVKENLRIKGILRKRR